LAENSTLFGVNSPLESFFFQKQLLGMEKTWQMRLKDQKWGVTFIASRGRWNIWNMYQPLVCFFPSGFRVSVKLGVSVQDGHSSLAWWAVTKTLAISFRGWHPTDPTQLWKLYSAVIRIPYEPTRIQCNVRKGFWRLLKSWIFFRPWHANMQGAPGQTGAWGKEDGGICVSGDPQGAEVSWPIKEKGISAKRVFNSFPFWATFPKILGFVELFQTFWKKVYKWAN